VNTPHPMQPLEDDGRGVIRFKRNEIVKFLIEKGSIDLNKLACEHFKAEDREQFAQLLGYSLESFCDLSYASETTKQAASEAAKQLLNNE
jgi:hypothetical protein